MRITYCKIHPAIGIARVGDSDSPDGWFNGPERPGPPARPDDGYYKDATGRVKRQVARFRVFGYDAKGNVVRELTADDEIQWTVHLANRKAAARTFLPLDERKDEPKETNHPRNDPAKNQGSLVIDPGPRSISGRNAGGAAEHRFDKGMFGKVPVELGELRTDADGHLLVFGGHGRAESPTDAPLIHFADNPGWFDDTSDGPVTAQVTLLGAEQPLPVAPAWVIVAPPDFAPSIGNVVTLYDVVEQVAFDAGRLPAPTHVSFEEEILPLLDRAAANQWVHDAALRGHRRGDRAEDDTTEVERPGDFLDAALVNLLSDTRKSPVEGSPDPAKARERVFNRIRMPTTLDQREADPEVATKAVEQATARFMPPLSGDRGDRGEGRPATWLTVTPLQYRRLALWAKGDFRVAAAALKARAKDADKGADDPPLTADELDRAALESCSGGGFFPGIEVSYRIKHGDLYRTDDRFRLDHERLQPGELTERMAVPWQADFSQCEGFWWPAQRPDRVVVRQDYLSVVEAVTPVRSGPFVDTLAIPRRRWSRGIENRPQPSKSTEEEFLVHLRSGMVEGWSKLGFVVPDSTADGTVWAESERDRYFGLRDRDYFHLMLNIDRYEDFRPAAKKLAERFFADAHDRIDKDRGLDTELQFFRYDETAFQTRLDSIYQYLADQVKLYDPKEDGTFKTREDVIERIRQFAPLNQTDGAWLRNITQLPHSEITEWLSHIWDDEDGNGIEERKHSTIYTKLMHDVGLNPAPVDSIEYAQDPNFLDSAFTVPLLQYVASEFTEEFLPEILGMTLHFEWESVYLKVNMRMFAHHGIDPGFYKLHLAIDNVAEGHGALAVRAVRRYLADFAGDEQQRRWRRIWDGYVAFRDSGTLGDDLKGKLKKDLDPKTDHKIIEARILEMIERKKQYGNLNHGGVEDKGMTNDLFDDPPYLLEVLRARKLVIARQPHTSPLVKAFAFDGSMYQVFTAEEQELWRLWIESLPLPNANQAAPAGPVGPPPGDGGDAAAAPVEAAPAEPEQAAAGQRRNKRIFLSSSDAVFRADPQRRLRGRGALQ